MLAKLLIHSNPKVIQDEVKRILESFNYTNPHPDLLILSEEKLGVEEAKQIRAHFSLKPFSSQGRVAVILNAEGLNDTAANALLKTFEELPERALLILGADTKDKLIPTLASRCEILYLEGQEGSRQVIKNFSHVEEVLSLDSEGRFEYIEKLKDRQGFLMDLIYYYQGRLSKDAKLVKFGREILNAEQWFKANGNVRAILEYLMLILPKQ